MKNKNSTKIQHNNMEDVLGIETVKLDDGTTIIKMGNNTYEFPLMSAPTMRKAANR